MSTLEADQFAVFGRGVNWESDQYPGQVTAFSEHSSDSYSRAATIGELAQDHPGEIQSVAFLGGHTFMLHPREVPRNGSEAEGMQAAAVLPEDITQHIDTRSQTTVGNLIELSRRRLADFSRPVGIVANDDHMERTLHLAKIVIPYMIAVPVVATNDFRRNPDGSSSLGDKVATLVYERGLRGVIPGELDAIEKVDQRIQRYFTPIIVPYIMPAIGGLQNAVATLRR